MSLSTTSRSIDTLPIHHSLRKSLQEVGYTTTNDILDIQPVDLSAELGITVEQAEALIKQCDTPDAGPSKSSPDKRSSGNVDAALPSSNATQLLSEQSLPRFSTLIDAIDDLIFTCANQPHSNSHDERPAGGAVLPGMVLELSGPPGIGKTSLALSLAISARTGSRKGKEPARSEVLIIDTEGGMTPDRILQAAESCLRTDPLDPIKVIHGIHVVRIATQVQMVAFLNTMDDWLTEHPEVDLIVIDTLSFHFRQPTLDMTARRRFMDLVKTKIAKATTVHQCAMVIVNQLATKLFTADNKQGNFDNGDKAVLMPQLGDMWTTAQTIKLALFRGPPGDDVRYAHASTSADGAFASKWAAFDIALGS